MIRWQLLAVLLIARRNSALHRGDTPSVALPRPNAAAPSFVSAAAEPILESGQAEPSLREAEELSRTFSPIAFLEGVARAFFGSTNDDAISRPLERTFAQLRGRRAPGSADSHTADEEEEEECVEEECIADKNTATTGGADIQNVRAIHPPPKVLAALPKLADPSRDEVQLTHASHEGKVNMVEGGEGNLAGDQIEFGAAQFCQTLVPGSTLNGMLSVEETAGGSSGTDEGDIVDVLARLQEKDLEQRVCNEVVRQLRQQLETLQFLILQQLNRPPCIAETAASSQPLQTVVPTAQTSSTYYYVSGPWSYPPQPQGPFIPWLRPSVLSQQPAFSAPSQPASSQLPGLSRFPGFSQLPGFSAT